MHYVYILKSKKDNKLYIGVSSNLRKRYAEHNAGTSKATKFRRPLVLVYYEAYGSYKDALIREKRLKKFKNSYKELAKRISNSIKA